ncbi:HAD domain-containing protein [uncultured Polaribacter sp.]|uniref:HAD domain-containing protein n=1 Tax=uncultured Polaribacter sp. TaxID=174711 RepID=UPI0026192C68|nr:HAD domain-containing protein [uncultured Polaribacter sp.]
MLIYLDIDGVMVPANSWRRPEILEDGFPNFSSRAIKALDRIISKSGADIVLTTSHKSLYSSKKWIAIFNKRNLYINKITSLPENRNHLNRKDELLKWFDGKVIDNNFVIIDDDKSLNSLPRYLKDKLIQTSGSVGLTEYLADEALKILEKSKFETA